MNNLSLKQLESLGISKYMSDQELEKNIANALLAQQKCLDIGEQKETPVTLDYVLVHGGLFTYTLNKKKYKINVLTKDDMQLLDNIENLIEEGIEHDIVKPYKFFIRNSHDNYVTLRAKDYIEAQAVIDEIFGKNTFKVSCSKL